jgi:hypothetical protein
VRESSKNNPTILPPRCHRARAVAELDGCGPREALKGRITAPAASASELVQIQLNEQLIVELYSK